MSKPPIFIVGVQRSGTTLLAALLAAHSRLSCGPETHFFRWLAQVDPNSLTTEATWPETAVSFLAHIQHTHYKGEGRRSLLSKYNLTEAEVSGYLVDKRPLITNLLASITEPYMHQAGKQRWVEKTPDHIEYLPLIRTHFPDSPIIRIVRDPRDVALSLMKVPWGAKSFLEALLFWQRRDQASRSFFDTDPLSYTLHFEQLVADPHQTISHLCHFLDEPFEASMLDTSSSGQQVNSAAVAWKRKASQPVDPNRLAVWQQTLTPAQNQLAEALLGDRLMAYGYPRLVDFNRYGQVYPAVPLAPKYEPGLTAVAADGIRFWPKDDEARGETAVTIYLGDPGHDNWLGQSWLEQLRQTTHLSYDLLRSRLSHHLVYWIHQTQHEQWSGLCAYWLKTLFLAPYSRRIVV